MAHVEAVRLCPHSRGSTIAAATWRGRRCEGIAPSWKVSSSRFATALALSQVTSTPDSVKTQFERTADQQEVARLLSAGSRYQTLVCATCVIAGLPEPSAEFFE